MFDLLIGWVYIVVDSFICGELVVLYWVILELFIDWFCWQGWVGGFDGGWNKLLILFWFDQFGEMSICQIDGQMVLLYFNVSIGNMEVWVVYYLMLLGVVLVIMVVCYDEWLELVESLLLFYDN